MSVSAAALEIPSYQWANSNTVSPKPMTRPKSSSTPLSSERRTALIELLHTHESYRSPEVLTIVPALSELALTLDTAAAGDRRAGDDERRRIYDADRRSLVCDVDLALTRAGPALVAFTTPTLKELRTKHVARLAKVLDDSAKCTALAATVRDMLEQLQRPEAVGAAWDDMITAFAASSDNGTCALRISQLADLIRIRGRDWSTVERGLQSAADKDELDTGRSEAMADAPVGVTVAWVAFGNAHLKTGYLRLGQVQFFGDQYSITDIRDAGGDLVDKPGFEQATELTDKSIEWHFTRIKADSHVLARVELVGPRAHKPASGTGPPIAWARDFVTGLVEAAGFRVGGTAWMLLDGGSFFTSSGDHAGSFGFDDPIQRKTQQASRLPRNEPTAWALPELEPSFADALAQGEPAAVRAVAEVRWHRGASQSDDPAMRLAVRVRAFETQWATGSATALPTWEQAVRYYLKDLWAWEAIRTRLFDAIVSIELPPHPIRLLHASNLQLITAVFNEAWNTNPDGSYVWYPGAVLRLAPTVAAAFKPGSVPRRRWNELKRAGQTGESARAWWDGFRQTFDVLLNRAVRQRNAVVHGQTLVPEVISSVEPFLAQLTGYIANLAIDAAAEGHDLDTDLEARRRALTERYAALANSPSGLALWPEE